MSAARVAGITYTLAFSQSAPEEPLVPTRSTSLRRASLALASVVFLLAAPGAWAAIKTWSGATDGAWSKGTNWVGGIAPFAGDSLVFPSAGASKAMTNDLANGFSVLGSRSM